MNTVKSDIEIELPVRVVYDQWTQFEDYPAFMTGVVGVRQLADDTVYWLIRIGGVERGFEAKIVEQRPDERIAWKSTSGPENAGLVTFESLGEHRTRVRLRLEWEPEGFAETVGAALQLDDAQVAADLRRFREIIEANGFATGSWRGSVEPDSVEPDSPDGRS